MKKSFFPSHLAVMLAVSTFACGGKVYFDGGNPSGGANAGGGGSSSHAGSGGSKSHTGSEVVGVGGSTVTHAEGTGGVTSGVTGTGGVNQGGTTDQASTTRQSATFASNGGGPVTATNAVQTHVATGPSTDATIVSASSGSNVCSCTTLCQDVSACGIPDNICEQICAGAPDSAKSCVCNAAPDCRAMLGCIRGGMGGGGPGSGPMAMAGVGQGPATFESSAAFASSGFATATGVGGGFAVTATGVGGGFSVGTGGVGGGETGVTGHCARCLERAGRRQCSMEAADCQQDMMCTSLLNCNEGCGFTFSCEQSCASQFTDDGTFADLMTCVVCDTCGSDCSSSDVEQEFCASTGL